MTPERVSKWIAGLGYRKVIINSDQEPAMLDLQEESRRRIVEERRKLVKDIESTLSEIVLENPPVGEFESNGAIQSILKQVQGQIRTLRLAFEGKIVRKLKGDDDAGPRFIEYAADTFNRFKVGEDGLTTFKGLKGREPNLPIVACAEKIMSHVPKTNSQGIPSRPIPGRMSLETQSYIGGSEQEGNSESLKVGDERDGANATRHHHQSPTHETPRYTPPKHSKARPKLQPNTRSRRRQLGGGLSPPLGSHHDDKRATRREPQPCHEGAHKHGRHANIANPMCTAHPGPTTANIKPTGSTTTAKTHGQGRAKPAEGKPNAYHYHI